MATKEITKYDDIIDSRDVIARIEALTDERDTWVENEGGDDDEQNRTAEDWAGEFPDEASELAALESLAEEASGSPDWIHGEALIRDSYFKEYAQELAEDCDMIPAGLSWPLNCIDWDFAARELQNDYFTVEFDGITYWIRS
jgi:hypothetical protein